jgi:2-methylcitrate dehydratase PrpD
MGTQIKPCLEATMRISRKAFVRLVGHGLSASFVGASIRGSASAQVTSRKVESAAIRGTTEALTTFIGGTDLSDMPADAVREARRCLVDGFGVVLAGSTVRGTAIVRDYVRATAGRQEATALGADSLRASAAHAALINGASGHAMDYDDTQLSSTPDRTFGLLTHPTVPVLAASLAVAERERASGARFLEAFLVGFEVECKIAEAIDPDHYKRGFHSTGTVGTFGAAAAAARLLGLDELRIRHTLAVAASMSSGIRVNFGTMTKPLHAGRAAENGVIAAELASRGFTGGDEGLDGRWGFFQVFGGGADIDRLVPALGEPWAIVTPGVSIKPYPCGSLSHPSMDAMLALVTEHDVKPEQIRAIRLRAGSNILEPLRYKTANNELEAKFSLPFLLGTIALRRKAGVREFTDEFVLSEPVQRMMERVTTVFDAEIEAKGFDKIRSVVEVDLTDGRTLVRPSDERYRGGPERPFTRAELHEKFFDCASLTLSEDQAREALGAIERVESLADAGELVRTMDIGQSGNRVIG